MLYYFMNFGIPKIKDVPELNVSHTLPSFVETSPMRSNWLYLLIVVEMKTKIIKREWHKKCD